VPESAVVDVRFSEPVTLGPGAVTLTCSISGNVGLTLTSNPDATHYVYTPGVLFASAETCTTTVSASLVSDLDGTPDTMSANATSTFTVATDVAPTVADRRPLAGATNVPTLSPVRVLFTEAVTVQNGWLTLSCAASGVHALTITGGPQRYSAQPVPALGGLETCTATVHAALVIDQDGSPNAMGANVSWSFGTGPAVGTYYQDANLASAAALRTSLHAIINDHTRYPYTSSGTDTWTILEQAEEDPNDPYRIVDVYKNVSYAKVTTTRPYNREHIWPKAYGFPDDGATNYPYTDTHMLHLTDNVYNSTRGTKPFGDCSSVCEEYATALTNGEGGGNGPYPGNSNWSDGVIWEVWGARKGDLARALLYMDVRYEGGLNGTTTAPEPDLVLTDNLSLIQTTGGNTAGTAYMGLLSVVLTWHYADPPTDRERLRNEVIFSYQHNRNPFVDHPEYVDCVFLELCTAERIFANGFEP
jgi:endonuclease I